MLGDGSQRGAAKQNSTVVGTPVLNVSTGKLDNGGSISTGVSPSEPVVFSAQVGGSGATTTAPPVTAKTCAELQGQWNRFDDLYNNSRSSAEHKKIIGQAMDSILLTAGSQGCAWTAE